MGVIIRRVRGRGRVSRDTAGGAEESRRRSLWFLQARGVVGSVHPGTLLPCVLFMLITSLLLFLGVDVVRWFKMRPAVLDRALFVFGSSLQTITRVT